MMKYRYLSIVLTALSVVAATASSAEPSGTAFVGPGSQFSWSAEGKDGLRLEVINGYGGVEFRPPPARMFAKLSFQARSSDFSAVTVRLIDETEQYHQFDVPLQETEWTSVEVGIPTGNDHLHWGGAGDGAWHGRMIGMALLAQTSFLRRQVDADYFHGILHIRFGEENR